VARSEQAVDADVRRVADRFENVGGGHGILVAGEFDETGALPCGGFYRYRQNSSTAPHRYARDRGSADGRAETFANGGHRPKPARGGFVVEWSVYSVSRRSLDSPRSAESGGSGHCRIVGGDLEKLQPNGRTSKRRRCANDPKLPHDVLRSGH
jgi:hypothetical protein